MQDIKEIFDRIRETKLKQKELRKMYKDELESSGEYQNLLEKIDQLKLRKKQIETDIKDNNAGNFKALDAYKMYVKTDMELLSDVAFNKLVSGETVEIVDGDNNRYQPVFSVRFKKA